MGDSVEPARKSDASPKGQLDNDFEKQVGRVEMTADLKRRLATRHLMMLGVGGTIGTGLFIGTGSAIAKAGPAGCLLAFIWVGTLVYSVMVGLAEMATYMPVTGGFTVYASRFVDPSLGFAMGYIYWFSWCITFALEMTITGLIIRYWLPEVSLSIFVGVFWVAITALNVLPIKMYGEIEMWLSSIKVITVIGFIIFGICIDAGAGQDGVIGVKNWQNPGAFAPYLLDQMGNNEALAKFAGFWAVLVQAGFSYQGTELVGVGAGETHNPRKTVPQAIKWVFWSIITLFVLTVFIIGLLIPYTNEALSSGENNASGSPFVIAVDLAGVRVLPHIINAVLLTVVLSAAIANVYSGSRVLVGLAEEGLAPRWMMKTTSWGVPYYAIACTAIWGLLGFLNESEGGTTVFNWLMNISGVAGFISWTSINVSHLFFRRALSVQGIPAEQLPYQAPAQPWLTWYGIFFNVIIILTQGFTSFLPWSVSEFFVAYVSLILFALLYIGHKAWTRCGFVKAHEADLITGTYPDE
ncbi:hypothetical protein MCOR27_004797 [Pyricularia oryzae]|uniref:Amino acid permease/ SLC12A domain-containing protein n=6 Tax=Pyricularia TaxID=48558 RepID=A0ABQ8NW98_PYRGI|nr:lysine-specific permease [Pyricularia oryzae 70-15]ELQ44254.1 lysine-specific permease [Pyricularia oryzae Y34]KAH8839490.1 hypothetical protein MCOR01_008688 [Pyricularia oryzae]KAI6303071.1 hypothetical protein MCOR33_001669 [Pyricularia grisea]EHA55282.1 lysine-specific permease [Pyricularia oryzae 70-15]KAH9439345.1 hypothetical protein MCOR02_002905 [Pyricularia oryzae]